MENIVQQFWIILFSFSSIHGFILGFMLWFKKNKQFIFNRPLTSLILLIAIILLNYTMGMIGVYNYIPHLRYTNIMLWLLFGPLFYYYFHSIVSEKRKFRFTDLIHFVPFLIGLIVFFPFFSLSTADKLAIMNGEKEHVIAFANYIFILYLYTLQNIIYVLLSFHMIRKYEQRLKKDSSNTQVVQIEWLNSLTLILIVFLLIDFVIGNTMMIFSVDGNDYYYASILIISTFIYFIGYKMVFQSEQFFTFISDSHKEPLIIEKYKNSVASDEEVKMIRAQLEELMLSSKPYLNDELRLADLANELKISTHLLSQVINQSYQKNFYQFINQYRMEEVLRQLKNDESHIQTISSIAFDAGFSSQASFYRVFKQSTGMTPSKYLKNKVVA